DLPCTASRRPRQRRSIRNPRQLSHEPAHLRVKCLLLLGKGLKLLTKSDFVPWQEQRNRRLHRRIPATNEFVHLVHRRRGRGLLQGLQELPTRFVRPLVRLVEALLPIR